MVRLSLNRQLWRAALVVMTVLAGMGGMASAAASAGGITVSPGQLQFSLSKDAADQKVKVDVTNKYNTSITIDAAFKGIDENAGLLIPTDKIDPDFAPAISISEPTFTIAPHETHTVSVAVKNLGSLTPGGHYATLVFTQQAAGNTQLQLRAALSVTIFAIKEQGAHVGLRLKSLHTDGWMFHLPSSVTMTFQNTGNVHVIPRASANVLSSNYSDTIAHGVANERSLILLPGSELGYAFSLTHTRTAWWPQKLRLVGTYRADGSDTTRTFHQEFWYVPPIFIIPVIMLLVLVYWVLRKRIGSFGKKLHQTRAHREANRKPRSERSV